MVSTKILSSTTTFNIDKKKCFLSMLNQQVRIFFNNEMIYVYFWCSCEECSFKSMHIFYIHTYITSVLSSSWKTPATTDVKQLDFIQAESLFSCIIRNSS